MSEKIRVVLPSKYDLVVGDTFQLFYRGVIEAPNPWNWHIVLDCEEGKAFPRYFECTPTKKGTYPLTMELFDANRNLVGKAETILNVVEPKKPEKAYNILCLGDSLTCNGEWVEELQRRLTKEGGEPFGLGFADKFNFIGECRRGEVGFVAYGGWRWDNFTASTKGAMWVECPNSRTSEDQHSLWKDENGAIWQLETLQIDYLKFNRYMDHTSPMPKSGFLTHYKNAVNTEPIGIKSSSEERTNPFYNPETKKVDIVSYVKNQGAEKLDAAIIYLGGNGLMRHEAMTMTRPEYCQVVVKEAKVLVDMLKEAFPDIVVRIMNVPLSSLHGGGGWNNGAAKPLSDRPSSLYYQKELSLAYENWTKEEGYRDFMEYIDVAGQFDSDYNYPHIMKPVNTRSTAVERMDTNSAHPIYEGYMQVADAVFRNAVHSFCTEA